MLTLILLLIVILIITIGIRKHTHNNNNNNKKKKKTQHKKLFPREATSSTSPREALWMLKTLPRMPSWTPSIKL